MQYDDTKNNSNNEHPYHYFLCYHLSFDIIYTIFSVEKTLNRSDYGHTIHAIAINLSEIKKISIRSILILFSFDFVVFFFFYLHRALVFKERGTKWISNEFLVFHFENAIVN